MSVDRPQFLDGEVYERFMGRWSARVAGPFLDWLSAPSGAAWIDIGCGNGAFTEQIVARAKPGSVHAIDLSERQLTYARTRAGAGGAEFHLGDAQRLPFTEARFDVAVMALVISAVPDQAGAVSEMRRVVRPGGFVAAYIWDIAGGGLPVEPLVAAMRALEFPFPALGDASLERLRNLWLDAGLADVETRVIRISIEFDSVDDFWETNTLPGSPTGATIAKLTAEDKARLRTFVSEHVPRDEHGRVRFEAFANAVKGQVP